MFIDYINKDILKTSRCPQTVKELPAFYKFIELMDIYTAQSTQQVYSLLSAITPIFNAEFSEGTDINYLRRLITKCGAVLNYQTEKNLGDTDTTYMRYLYYTAIQGFVVSRCCDSTRVYMQTILNTLFGDAITNITIFDGGLGENSGGVGPGNMAYVVKLYATVIPDTLVYLSSYIHPYITGIRGQFDFLVVGIQGSMLFDTTTKTELIPSDYPTEYAENTNAMLFMDFDVDTLTEVAIASSEETTIPVYLQTGSWMLEI